MVFYPDNEKRASRLQQLVDSMANMQTDVKHISQKMDHDLGEKYRPAIDKLLKENGLDSVDDVINKAAAQMTPEARKAFEALIKVAKSSKTGFSTTYLVAGLLFGPGAVIVTGKGAINIARWAVRIVNVNAIATFFRAAESGTVAAAAAAEEVVAQAAEAEKILQEAGEAGEEISTAATWLGRLGTFFKVLSAVGLVISIIAALIEIIEGAEQKEKLIKAIHGLQPARLTTAFLKQEGMNIEAQLKMLALYLDTLPGGKHPNHTTAAYISLRIIEDITEENKQIDLSALERDLETQDRTSDLFYGDDDLAYIDVIAAASKTKA